MRLNSITKRVKKAAKRYREAAEAMSCATRDLRSWAKSQPGSFTRQEKKQIYDLDRGEDALSAVERDARRHLGWVKRHTTSVMLTIVDRGK